MVRVLIPAYNEEANITNCVLGVHQNLRKTKHLLYAVNDGSHDQTLTILKKLARDFPLKIIDHGTNRGVAEVFRSGIYQIARDGRNEDALVVIEGDGTSDPRLLPPLVEKINRGCDVVIASRYRKPGGYVKFPARRLFLSRAANLLLQAVFPHQAIRDYTIFYRAYRLAKVKEAIAAYKDHLITTNYFAANAEILVKMMKLTNKIEEIGFLYDYSRKKGGSGMRIKKNTWEYFRLIYNQKLAGKFLM